MQASNGTPKGRNGESKKRVVTTARREQNRVAQRAWRQRQREKCVGLKGTDTRRPVSATRSSPTSAASVPPTIDVDTTQDGRHENLLKSGGLEGTRPLPLSLEGSGDQLTRYNQSFLSSVSSDLSCPSSPSSQESSRENGPVDTNPQPSLKLNTLQTSQTRTLLALLNNAVCLGFDINKLMQCSNDHLSPFYRSITPMDNPHDMIASALNPSLPVHLQPTFAQMLIPHHPAIDLVPLPLLRDRLIMMAFAMPNVYSLWDLKLDIYVGHGIVPKRASSGDCLSWDRGFWEVEPWFREKWGIPVCE